MERERRRRIAVNETGRLGESIITEVMDGCIYYSYTIRGVQYSATQDITRLSDFLPHDPERMVGPASLKYSPNNAANSILVCEEWSGVRAPSQADSELA